MTDLAELGAVGGLAYDLSFNKFGMRVAVLGFSQTLPSYARRLCRKLVNYHFELLDGPETLPSSLTRYAVASAKGRARGAAQQMRRRQLISNLRGSKASDAAFEGIAFLRSCHGATCFAEGDLTPSTCEALMKDLQDIFAVATGGGSGSTTATPTVEDLVYTSNWKPRSASSCSIPGVSLISDACGRIPR